MRSSATRRPSRALGVARVELEDLVEGHLGLGGLALLEQALAVGEALLEPLRPGGGVARPPASARAGAPARGSPPRSVSASRPRASDLGLGEAGQGLVPGAPPAELLRPLAQPLHLAPRAPGEAGRLGGLGLGPRRG